MGSLLPQVLAGPLLITLQSGVCVCVCVCVCVGGVQSKCQVFGRQSSRTLAGRIPRSSARISSLLVERSH